MGTISQRIKTHERNAAERDAVAIHLADINMGEQVGQCANLAIKLDRNSNRDHNQGLPRLHTRFDRQLRGVLRRVPISMLDLIC